MQTEVSSRPVWGAWIEMYTFTNSWPYIVIVAPRMGRVD